MQERSKMDADAIVKRMDHEKGKSFDRWMASAATRALISIMPPSEHTEMILRAAFEAGHGAGQGAAIGEVMTTIIDGMKKPPLV
jgi:hypothetical protein